MTWEGYRDAVHHCREKSHVAKDQLEFKLASTKDNKKGSFKYAYNKRRIKDNSGPLLDEVGHLTNRDADKERAGSCYHWTSLHYFSTVLGVWKVSVDCKLANVPIF